MGVLPKQDLKTILPNVNPLGECVLSLHSGTSLPSNGAHLLFITVL